MSRFTMIASMRSFSSSETRTVMTVDITGLPGLVLRLDTLFLQFFLAVAISKLHRHRLDLLGGKDRAILADVDVADVAAAALAQAALHPVLQRRVDLFVRKAELFQHRQGELDHDRRPADQGDGVFGRRGRFFENGRHETDLAVPFGAVAPRIDGLYQAHIPPLLPLPQLPFVDQISLRPGAVDDRDVAELVAQVQAVPDQGSQGRQGDAPGDEDQILAVELFHRVGVAVGASDPHGVADFQAAQLLGHPADGTETALDVSFPGRGRGDAEGGLSGSEGGVFGELAGTEGKVLPDLSILEDQLEGAYVRSLVDDLRDGSQVGEVDVLVGVIVIAHIKTFFTTKTRRTRRNTTISQSQLGIKPFFLIFFVSFVSSW